MMELAPPAVRSAVSGSLRPWPVRTQTIVAPAGSRPAAASLPTPARLAAEAGLKNVFVSNGYMTAEALKTIQPYLHAVNIDLKGFDDKRHRRLCGAKLQPVLDSIRLIKKLGIWLEVTTLVIQGHNDSDSELRQIALFLSSISNNHNLIKFLRNLEANGNQRQLARFYGPGPQRSCEPGSVNGRRWFRIEFHEPRTSRLEPE